MKIFVSDYDMTMYINERIDDKVFEAVKKWREAGNIFVIATGRNRFSISEHIERYDIGFDYVVANNGALVLDKEGKILFKEAIDCEEAYKVIKSLHDKFEGSTVIATEENVISVNSEKEELNSAFKINKKININEIYSVKNIIQINKIDGSMENIPKVADYVNNNFSGVVAYGNIRVVDIVRIGVNKAKGVAFLEDKIKNVEKVLVAGDSNNDIDMIKKYDGYVQINAMDNIKAVSDKRFNLISDIMNDNL